VLAAEKIASFREWQGPGQKLEGRQAVIRSGSCWLVRSLARWLVDAACLASWVTYVGESATDGVGRLQNLEWPPSSTLHVDDTV